MLPTASEISTLILNVQIFHRENWIVTDDSNNNKDLILIQS